MFRRHLRLLVILLFAVCSQAAAQTRQVTLLYTNDFHATVAPIKATWLIDQPMIGGIRSLAAWADELRKIEPNAFLFDAGDVYTGQAISSMTRGQALIEMWKAIGFDAATFGNHEFDYGIQGAKAYQQQEPFPVLACNLFYRASGKPFAKPFAVLERNGIRIGVIGVFGPDAVPSSNPDTWNTLEVRDPAPILRELIPTLRKQVDLIVVLAHEGESGSMQADAEAHPEMQKKFDADKALAAAVPGIDVLIGGHAHRGIEVPFVSPGSGTIIVQTYGRGTTIGVIKLMLDSQDKITGHEGSLVRVVPGVFPVPDRVNQVVNRWEMEAERVGKEVVGTSAAALTRSYNAESNLGDVIADAMLWKSGADIAFENAGGIRSDLSPGKVTRYDLISVLPFINSLTTIKLTGKQVRDILEQALTLKVGMMQVAGMKLTYDLSKPELQRVLSVTVGGQPLADAGTYTVATNSFLTAGGDGYKTFLDGHELKDTGINLVDVVVEYFQKKGEIAAPTGPRLVPSSN